MIHTEFLQFIIDSPFFNLFYVLTICYAAVLSYNFEYPNQIEELLVISKYSYTGYRDLIKINLKKIFV